MNYLPRAGTAGSLAANIATAHPDLVSRVIAGWPALALILAVKLLSGMLKRGDPCKVVIASVAYDTTTKNRDSIAKGFRYHMLNAPRIS
jgi:hypothetical protein